MSDERPDMFAIIKAELIWVVIILLALLVAYKIGVFAEKIGALEDVVFNHSLCNHPEKE